jgi:hypothetical protein
MSIISIGDVIMYEGRELARAVLSVVPHKHATLVIPAALDA